MNIKSLNPRSAVLYAGGGAPAPGALPEVPPIHHATAYVMADMDAYEAANEHRSGYVYSRTSNPTRDALAQAVSYLEGAEETVICASGMAAISSTLLALATDRAHIVVSDSVYGETRELLENILSHHGMRVGYADFTRPDRVEEAMEPDTALLYTEVITNPHIQVVDLDAIAALAARKGALVVVDGTFTTPFVLRPLEHGAHLVINSLTKFYGGHGDLTAGSVSGSAELVRRVRATQELLGGCADPNSCWLALRSVHTMEMRMARHLDNAAALAAALEGMPPVRAVHHPSLPSHPQHRLATRLFRQGYGAMLSFRVEDDRAKVNAFIRRLRMIRYLGTLGGMRSSLAHPATAFRFDFPPEKLMELGMHEGFIRISVGVEEIGDIVEDIRQALDVFQ